MCVYNTLVVYTVWRSKKETKKHLIEQKKINAVNHTDHMDNYFIHHNIIADCLRIFKNSFHLILKILVKQKIK